MTKSNKELGLTPVTIDGVQYIHSEEKPFDGDWHLKHNGVSKYRGYESIKGFKIIASNDPSLSLPSWEVEGDTMEKVIKSIPDFPYHANQSKIQEDRILQFGLRCYKANTNSFTEEDMKKAFKAGTNEPPEHEYPFWGNAFNRFMVSLNKEMVSFDVLCEDKNEFTHLGGKSDWQPKLKDGKYVFSNVKYK